MARKELTIEQRNEKRLKVLFKSKWINPRASNILYLRVLANLCRGVAEGRKGANKRLSNALDNGMPHNVPPLKLLPVAEAAVRSACNRLANSRAFDDGEYDMWSMFLGDAADHLNVAKRIDDGASATAVYNLLWKMDTASRDEMHDKVWNWIEKSLAA
jgi:hypothetical protein